jgi:hypothetical protein
MKKLMLIACLLVRPVLSLPQPKFFWDDRDIAGGVCTWNYDLTGCLPSPAGCHLWELNYNCHTHDQTINTWWYTVKTTEAPVTITTIDGVYTTLYHGINQ